MVAPVKKVAVIGGGGMVGAATAYALIVKNVAAEVIIVDVAQSLAEGQAIDIADASFVQHGTCRVGTAKDAGKADVTVITAGFPQKPGQPRSELLTKNRDIMKSICESMMPINPEMKILVVANPVDVLTALVQEFSGLPKAQVFGSGTYLDSGRLRLHLSEMLSVSPNDIHALVLGEHGDRQFVGWSSAMIGHMPLLKHEKMKGVDLAEVQREVMRKAYKIIDAKRSTYFGVGMCAATITEAVLNNTSRVFPLTNYVEKYKTYVCWPCSVGSHGVEQTFDCALNDAEEKQLHVAIDAIKELIQEAHSG